MKISTSSSGIEIDFRASTNRRCGGCTACCKLLPVVALHKGAGVRCIHQRSGKGCAVYTSLATVSPECASWSCRWLAAAEETADLLRPDRSHYVIDMMPDIIRLTGESGEIVHEFLAIQIWMDPAFPEAKNDPRLRAYMFKMAEASMASLLRWNGTEATAVFPPPLCSDGQWHEVTSAPTEGIGLFSRMSKQSQEVLKSL